MKRKSNSTREPDTESTLRTLRAEFRANGDPIRASGEKAYLKSPHLHHGLNMRQIRRAALTFRKLHPDIERNTLHTISSGLWASPYHEEKTLAVEMLNLYPQHLDPEAMPMLERMLRESAGWAHIDAISIRLVGGVLMRHPQQGRHLMRWAKDESFWMRRAALISQILPFRAGRGDIELFLALAQGMMDEKEFFIRKAIGWTLRELSVREPEVVYDYIVMNMGRASGLTIREGAKRLPGALRAKLIEMLNAKKEKVK